MTQSAFFILALLPVAEWLVWGVAGTQFRREVAHHVRRGAPMPESSLLKFLALGSKATLATHVVVLFGTGLWLWRSNLDWQMARVTSEHLIRNIVLGVTCGLSWFGALIILSALQRKLLPAGHFTWEIPALYATGAMRVLLLLLGATALELWRAVALGSLLRLPNSTSAALLICTAVYAVRLLPRGLPRVGYGVLEGLVYSGLLVWLGDMVAPLAARLVFETAMAAIFRGSVPALPRATFPAIAICPACRRGLSRQEIGGGSAFPCPHCSQIIGVPSWRRPVIRAVYFLCVFGFVAVFGMFAPGQLHGPDRNVMMAFIGSMFAAFGVGFVLDSILSTRLELGTPDTPSLDLTKRPPPPDRKTET